MSPRLRRLTGRELSRELRGLGFEIVNIEGSHAKFRRTRAGQNQVLTIPLHDTLAPGTLVAIYRQLRRFVPEDEARPIFYK